MQGHKHTNACMCDMREMEVIGAYECDQCGGHYDGPCPERCDLFNPPAEAVITEPSMSKILVAENSPIVGADRHTCPRCGRSLIILWDKDGTEIGRVEHVCIPHAVLRTVEVTDRTHRPTRETFV